MERGSRWGGEQSVESLVIACMKHRADLSRHEEREADVDQKQLGQGHSDWPWKYTHGAVYSRAQHHEQQSKGMGAQQRATLVD